MHIREAVEADNNELIGLQSRCPQGTTFIASIVNTPDFFARARIHADHRIYVACEDKRIVGSIACSLRDGYVNGSLEKVGRVFQLFVDPSYRGQRMAGQLLQACEDYLKTRGAVLSYGYIVEGNTPSIKNILRQGYVHRRALTMPGVPVFKQMNLVSSATIRHIGYDDLAAIAALFNRTWADHDLFEPVSAGRLVGLFESVPGFSYEDTFILEENGELCCCLGCWDLSRIMRMTVKALSLEIRLAGFLLDIGRVLLPLPQPPKPGEVLEQVIIEPIAFSDPKYVQVMLRYVNNHVLHRGIRQIFFGCEKGSQLFRSLKGFTHIDVTMHLYLKYLREGIRLDSRPIYMTGLDL